MRLRRLWPAALIALTPVLAACGDDDNEPDDDATEPSSQAPSPTEATSATEEPTQATSEPTSEPPAADLLPAACDLITGDDLAKAMGITFGPAEPGGGTTSEQDLEWRSDNCSFEAEDLVEVTIKVTGPSDFVKGTFGCSQPSEIASIVEPADDIPGATDGWWKVSDAPPLEAELRACSATANVEVEMEYEDGVDYEGDPRQQAAQIATHVLNNLQG
ncbi:hypothetical protein [Nocardioides sp. J54]|uniref:hypothetical protein n=1 Tax=Nocardioides sp. J54 TaxID=935866 RepID=UPI00048AA672|nr:hypothetical protein [Nocardioides sp. J54]